MNYSRQDSIDLKFLNNSFSQENFERKVLPQLDQANQDTFTFFKVFIAMFSIMFFTFLNFSKKNPFTVKI